MVNVATRKRLLVTLPKLRLIRQTIGLGRAASKSIDTTSAAVDEKIETIKAEPHHSRLVSQLNARISCALLVPTMLVSVRLGPISDPNLRRHVLYYAR